MMQPQFTLLKCSLGGLPVGIAAAAMMIVNGRVLGFLALLGRSLTTELLSVPAATYY